MQSPIVESPRVSLEAQKLGDCLKSLASSSGGTAIENTPARNLQKHSSTSTLPMGVLSPTIPPMDEVVKETRNENTCVPPVLEQQVNGREQGVSAPPENCIRPHMNMPQVLEGWRELFKPKIKPEHVLT